MIAYVLKRLVAACIAALLAAPVVQEGEKEEKKEAGPDAKKTPGVLPETYVVFPVAEAEAGQAGWVLATDVMVDRKRRVYLRKSAVLERYASARATRYVQYLGPEKGWVLWILPDMRIRPSADSEVIVLTAGGELIPIVDFDYKLVGGKDQ